MMSARLPLTIAFLALGAQAGCVSLKRTSGARFFTLRPVAEAPAAAAPAGEGGASIVGVLPVSLPGSLERPQLVTWSAPGEVRIDEFLRWTEPLDSSMQRVIVENLEILLPSRRVIKAPWPSSVPLHCRVRVDVVRFGPQPGGEVSLSGRFFLLPERGERALVNRVVDLKRAAASGASDPGRAVEAMSALLADLSDHIAAAIATLSSDRPRETSSSKEGPASAK